MTVDNYSVRSNNGQAMFWTNPSVNAQVNAMLGYDLVVLQYGLNIMQAGVHAYNSYGRQVEKMVAYVRQCFPGAAVLVLGVSDRSVKGEAGFEPMDAVPYMSECQRRAARNTGAAFWPTSDAMRVLGAWSASWPAAGRARTTPTSTTRAADRWPGRSSTPSTPHWAMRP